MPQGVKSLFDLVIMRDAVTERRHTLTADPTGPCLADSTATPSSASTPTCIRSAAACAVAATKVSCLSTSTDCDGAAGLATRREPRGEPTGVFAFAMGLSTPVGMLEKPIGTKVGSITTASGSTSSAAIASWYSVALIARSVSPCVALGLSSIARASAVGSTALGGAGCTTACSASCGAVIRLPITMNELDGSQTAAAPPSAPPSPASTSSRGRCRAQSSSRAPNSSRSRRSRASASRRRRIAPLTAATVGFGNERMREHSFSVAPARRIICVSCWRKRRSKPLQNTCPPP